MRKGIGRRVLAATCMVAASAWAEVSYWQGTVGGDLSDARLWSPSLTQDRNYFEKAQTGPLTISGDFNGLYWPWFKTPGNYVLDLGGHTLTVGYRTHFDGGTSGSNLQRVTIANGIYAIKAGGYQVFIGDGNGYNHVKIEENAALIGSTTSQIYVGDKTYWNSLTVNGTLEGQVYLANTRGGNNVLTIDGANARWNYAFTGRTIVGLKGSGNTVNVQNGAQAHLSGSLDIAYDASVSGNKVHVGNGATLTVAGEVNVGYSGPSNEIVVEQGGTFNAKTMGNVYIGRQGSASGNALTVAGTVNSDYTNTSSTPIWYVGANNPDNLLRILPGGRVNMANANLYLANAAAASGNRVEVLGGELDAKRVIVGLKGADCSLMVSNGVVRVADTLDATYDAGAARGRIDIRGRDSAVTVGSLIRLRQSSILAFAVPRDGFATVPLKVQNLEAQDAARLVVTLADGKLPRRDVVLVESVQDMSEPSVNRIKQNLTVPENTKLVFGNNTVTLKVPKSFVLIIR